MSSNNGIRIGCRTTSSCVTTADPTSAPNKIARPVAVASPPLETKLDTRTATAVALCNKTAAPMPVAAARNRLLAEWRSQMRMGAAKPRSTPVRTNRTAQIKSAAAPAMRTRIKRTCGSFTGHAFCQLARSDWKGIKPGPRPNPGGLKPIAPPMQQAAVFLSWTSRWRISAAVMGNVPYGDGTHWQRVPRIRRQSWCG